jgi:hypothetical protein
MITLYALPLFAIAVGAVACARSSRDDRNYYPMQKTMWFVLAFIYGGSGAAALFNSPTRPEVRAVFTVLMFGAVLYSFWFIRKRNATPRYLPLTLGGQTEMVPTTELWHDYERAISLTAHGDAPPQWVAQMEQAMARWREEQRHPETLGQRMKRQAQERRAGGIPDDD